MLCLGFALLTSSPLAYTQDLEAEATLSPGGFTFYPMPWGADYNVFKPPAATVLEPHPPRVPHQAQQQPHDKQLQPPQHDDPSNLPRVLIFGMLGDKPGDDESSGTVLFAAAHAGMVVRHVGDKDDGLCRPCPNGIVNMTHEDATRLLCTPLESLHGKSACSYHRNLGIVSEDQLVEEMRFARYVCGRTATKAHDTAPLSHSPTVPLSSPTLNRYVACCASTRLRDPRRRGPVLRHTASSLRLAFVQVV